MENRKTLSPMKKLKYILFFLLLAGIQGTALAQKKPYYNTQEAVIEAAYTTLDQEMKTGKILEWAQEVNLTGTYTYDITLRGKGEVVTVRSIESSGELKQQNALKDYLKTLRFPFKMPKDKSYKFRYEFKF
jgi:hypothetical protein